MTKTVFPIGSITRLARLLDISKANLLKLAEDAHALYRPGHLILIGKEPRPIRVPVPQLAIIQRRILERVFVDFEPHECSYGGVKGRTAIDNAKNHLDKLFVLKIDIRKFYPNVHYRWVQAFFERRLGCIPPVASILRRLLTLDRGLPQGTCTSPALADQIIGRVDTRLQRALNGKGITYTRWVDDLTLSAAFSMKSYVPFVARLLKPFGLRIHTVGDKAPHQYGPGEAAIVNGLEIIGGRVSVRQCYIETIRKELRGAWRFAEGYSTEPPSFGKESYWGTIRYIARFSKRQARELIHLFESVDWDKLQPLALPGRRGKVMFGQ